MWYFHPNKFGEKEFVGKIPEYLGPNLSHVYEIFKATLNYKKCCREN